MSIKIEKKYYGHPDFYIILNELRELHSRKNKQYASNTDPLGNFRRCGNMASKLFKEGVPTDLAICLCYMSKQIDGVFEIVGESKKNTVDSLKDKLEDIAVYSIIAIILSREGKKDDS